MPGHLMGPIIWCLQELSVDQPHQFQFRLALWHRLVVDARSVELQLLHAERAGRRFRRWLAGECRRHAFDRLALPLGNHASARPTESARAFYADQNNRDIII